MAYIACVLCSYHFVFCFFDSGVFYSSIEALNNTVLTVDELGRRVVLGISDGVFSVVIGVGGGGVSTVADWSSVVVAGGDDGPSDGAANIEGT